jgi:Fic family protein
LSFISADKNNRLEYYNALETAQIKNDKKMFYGFISLAVENALSEFLKIVR